MGRTVRASTLPTWLHALSVHTRVLSVNAIIPAQRHRNTFVWRHGTSLKSRHVFLLALHKARSLPRRTGLRYCWSVREVERIQKMTYPQVQHSRYRDRYFRSPKDFTTGLGWMHIRVSPVQFHTWKQPSRDRSVVSHSQLLSTSEVSSQSHCSVRSRSQTLSLALI